MLALALTCISDLEDAFTALAFELKLLHQSAELPIKGLFLICGLLSSHAASLIPRPAEIFCFFLNEKTLSHLSHITGSNGKLLQKAQMNPLTSLGLFVSTACAYSTLTSISASLERIAILAFTFWACKSAVV